MKRVLTYALVAVLGSAVAARAKDVTPVFSQGTPVVVIGMVSSQPRDAGFINEKKMQVEVGPGHTDYTLHLKDARLVGYRGQEIGVSDLHDKMWVRAEGTVMNDSRRIHVDRLQVVGTNVSSLEPTAYRRAGHNYGYVYSMGTAVTPAIFREGAGVVVVGRISSEPKRALKEEKMQVAVGPDNTDYTVHFKDAVLLGMAGRKIEYDDFDDGQWVRVEGSVMNDPRRIKADRVQIIAPDNAAFPRSAFYRPGLGYGYVTAVAGSRQTYPYSTEVGFAGPMTLIGKVSDDTGAPKSTRRIQVMSGGNEWTLNVTDDALVRDAKGEKISVHEVHKGQWVRASGWQTDDLRMRVNVIENIGADEAFRRSTFYREATPLGYFERSIGEVTVYDPVVLSGQVTSVNREDGYVVIRDSDGNYHRIYGDRSLFDFDGRTILFNDVVVGDRLTITGRTIR